jgi:hypothetical protein
MTKYRLILSGLIMLTAGILLSQPNQNKYSFSISSGYGFSEKKPVVYFNLNYFPSKEFYAGIRAGCYTYSESIDEAATRVIGDFFKEEMPGNYSVYPYFAKQNPTYVAALNGGYKAGSRLTLNFSLGVRYYQDYYFTASNIMFKKSYMGQPPPEIKLTKRDNDPNLWRKKDILRGYISAGLDYNINSFLIGIYADNIFSAGINLGKEF